MKTTRRSFIQGCCAAATGAFAGQILSPSFTYSQAGPSNLKNVIEIFLAGGPDAIQVFPYLGGPVDAALRLRRPNISPDPATIIVPTGFNQNGRANEIGFNANWATLINTVNTLNSGISLVSNFGATLNASRSHEVAQQMYRDASTLGTNQVQAGWVGRLAQQLQLPGMAVWGFGEGDPKMMAVSGPDKPVVLSSVFTGLSGLTFTDKNFGAFSCSGAQVTSCGNSSASAANDSIYLRDVMRRLHDTAVDQNNDLHKLMAHAQKEVFNIVPLAARMITQTTLTHAFGNGVLAERCRDIARASHYLNLSADAPTNVKQGTKIFRTVTGGWDTHQNQVSNVNGLVTSLSAALSGLMLHLNDWGLLNSTVIVVYGEFGRTNAQNGSTGTDHAEAGHCLVLGGNQVARGVFGPDASVAEAANANFFTAQVPQTGILKAILSKTFDASDLNQVFPNPMPGSVPQFLL